VPEMPITAARLHQHGAPLQVEPADLPAVREGEVLVELQYGGVNPIDRYIAEGQVADDGPLPRTLGGEAAGMLDGRAVLVAGGGLGATRDGVWASAAVVRRQAVIEVPDGVDPRAVAAMGIAGLTAWNVVDELGRITPQDRVLVLGASGGVGSMIVSLVAAVGAEVWGQTGSEDKAPFIAEQGADRVLVGGPDDLAEHIGEFQPTAILDALGGRFVGPAVEALAAEGRLVSFGTSAGPEVTFNLRTLYRKSGAILGYGGTRLPSAARRAGLEAALRALADGRIKVRIDEVLPLTQVNEAFERLVQRRVRGKLLLDLRS
jgi:NADPH:quinone reductase